MYYNWTVVDVPNCWQRFFRQGDPEPGPSKCYVFETNNTYRMATGLTYDNRPALRRLDFYWNINSVYNLSFITASIPTITVQLYDPHFSFWKKYTLGKTKVEVHMLDYLFIYMYTNYVYRKRRSLIFDLVQRERHLFSITHPIFFTFLKNIVPLDLLMQLPLLDLYIKSYKITV